MADTRPRRGHGEDSIYYDQANHYWVAAVGNGRRVDYRADDHAAQRCR